MRYAFALLAFLMILAAAVQYNDPDGPLWMVYYGVPALWAGVAAWRPHLIAAPAGRTLLAICTAAWLGLTAWYWPTVAGWWRNDVWRMGMTDLDAAAIAEQAREGMGLMIATAVLVCVLAGSFRMRPVRRGGAQPG